MHYIIGTSFDVHPQIRGTAERTALQKNRASKRFPEPGAYELYYIRRRPDRVVEYTFYNRSTGNKHLLEFNATSEADKLISLLIGETLPDYAKNYEEMSD